MTLILIVSCFYLTFLKQQMYSLHIALQSFKSIELCLSFWDDCVGWRGEGIFHCGARPHLHLVKKCQHSDFFSPILDGNKSQCVTVEQKFCFPNSFHFHLSIVNHCPSIHTIFQPYFSSSFLSVFTSLHLAARMLLDISIYPSMELIFHQQNIHQRLGGQSCSFLSSDMKQQSEILDKKFCI